MDLLYFVGIVLIGAQIGSFLNVVIYRLPRGESVLFPGSRCPSCHQFLRAWNLIPLFSFVLQKGRCRNCGVRISWRYPGVELLTGILFALTIATGVHLSTHPARIGLQLIFVSVLIVLAFIDLDTFCLPDVFTIPLLGLGLLGALLLPGAPGAGESLGSALGAGIVFWGIAQVYPQGMGLGDVKLVAALGAFLGFPSIVAAVFMGSLLGVVVGGASLWRRTKRLNLQIPFGPYLAAGAVFALWWGRQLFDWCWS